jgi:hypothetical protein
MKTEDTSLSSKAQSRQQRHADRAQRRKEREQHRMARRLEREKRGVSGADMLFAGSLIEVIAAGMHNLAEDVVQVLQERQARDQGHPVPKKEVKV